MSDHYQILSLSNKKTLISKYSGDIAKSYILGLTQENNASSITEWRKINKGSLDEVRNYFENILSFSNENLFEMFIATKNDKYIGYHFVGKKQCLGEDPEWIGYINGLFVHEEYRRLGLAQKMFNMGQKWFSENKIHYIELSVNLGNIAGIGFWNKNGFNVVEQIMGKRF